MKTFSVIYWNGNDDILTKQTIKARQYCDAMEICRNNMDGIEGAVDFSMIETTPKTGIVED